jgi:hypothetical protein
MITALQAVQEQWLDFHKARIMLDSATGDPPNLSEHEGSGYSRDQPIFAKMVSQPSFQNLRSCTVQHAHTRLQPRFLNMLTIAKPN